MLASEKKSNRFDFFSVANILVQKKPTFKSRVTTLPGNPGKPGKPGKIAILKFLPGKPGNAYVFIGPNLENQEINFCLVYESLILNIST